MAISHEQILELQKYQKMIQQLEKIAKVSQNDEQRYRVSRDLEKYKTKMKDISPEGIPDNLDVTAEQIKRYKENPNEAGRVIAKYPIMKISPNSNDPEVNQIGTWINVMDREYLPVLNETHVRFDFFAYERKRRGREIYGKHSKERQGSHRNDRRISRRGKAGIQRTAEQDEK